MTRNAAIMAGVAVAVALNLATKVMGQIPADPSTGTSTEREQQTEVKKDEPNWQGMLKADNRSYLANVSRVRQELDRFQKDRLWGGMLLQMMGMEYPNVGRY